MFRIHACVIDTKDGAPSPLKQRMPILNSCIGAIARKRALCHLSPMPHRLTYAATPLERTATQRHDAGWLAQQLASPDVRVLPVWRDANLIAAQGEQPTAIALHGAQAQEALAHTSEASSPVFLGTENDAPFFMMDLSHLDETVALSTSGIGNDEGTCFTDLRASGALMSHAEGSMLAFARGMAYWHRRHRFCGVCGTPTHAHTGGHTRRCNNETCAVDHFPRTDPAVIMLVTAALPGGEPNGHCLLGRQASWAEGMYSSLAGFVEPGESLESAVAREVMEESSIAVTDVRYLASQPWPFPSSLMLGFRARATSFDIDVGEDELEDARWFSRDEIEDMSAQNRDDLRLSRSDSIARWLIEDWLRNP